MAPALNGDDDERQFELGDEDGDIEKGEPLLGSEQKADDGAPTMPARPYVPPMERKRPITPLMGLLGLVLLFGSGYGIARTAVAFTRYGHDLKVNVILCISDGFGPASEALARSFVQSLHSSNHALIQPGGRWAFTGESESSGFHGKLGLGNGGLGFLPLDPLLVGSSRTRSSNSLVTDSAAGATAFACGLKTYNGAIGVDKDGKPCATVLEAAAHKHWLTGLVATSRITHATPASFYAHVLDRDNEADIASMLVDNHPLGHLQVDYALGGGSCFFLPNTTAGSCRPDALDLMSRAKANGIKIITSPAEFDGLAEDETALGTIGLFNRDHMEYEIDRMHQPESSREPSLAQMARKAIRTLSAAARKRDGPGFFLMIEGSRIDMAGHSNDAATHVADILAYNEMITVVKQMVESENKRGMPTVMISVSDHETGGLTLARQLTEAYPLYEYFPDALVNATASTISLAGRTHAGLDRAALRQLVNVGLGVSDPTDDELASIESAYGDTWKIHFKLGDMQSRRAQLGWTTTGHSGVDVNLYASGYRVDELRGSRENTEIGAFIASLLELDLEPLTRDLNRQKQVWLKSASETTAKTDLLHYHGAELTMPASSPMHLYLDGPTR